MTEKELIINKIHFVLDRNMGHMHGYVAERLYVALAPYLIVIDNKPAVDDE